MIKKILCGLVSCLLLFPLMLTSCGKDDLETVTLNVYNWGQYISDGSDDLPDTNALFEEYFNTVLAEERGYKIKVNYSTYASNEDMYNKLSSGSANFDVIIPSDYMIEQLIREDMLEKLDFDKIPNYKYIVDAFKTEYNQTYDPQGAYSVPYTYGLVGIIYNTEHVSEEDIGSWDLLWNENYKGKILQFNNSRDAFATALYKLGYSVNTTDHEKWNEACEELKKQKPLVQAYVMDEIFNKMISGSAYIAPYYAGDFLTCYASNESLSFYIPEEGTNFFVDAMCIPKNATRSEANLEAAHDYINFMLSEEAAVANSMYIGYASPNILVQNNQDYKDYMAEEVYEDYESILYPENMKVFNDVDLIPQADGEITEQENEVLAHQGLKVSSFRTITNTEENGNLLNHVNSLWSEFKADVRIELWITLLAVAIILALAGFGVFAFIRKKSREKYY